MRIPVAAAGILRNTLDSLYAKTVEFGIIKDICEGTGQMRISLHVEEVRYGRPGRAKYS
jgi:hypothetical protein